MILNNRIDARIAALAKAIERNKMERAEPLDSLSASMFEFEDEMASLDEIGIAALAAETEGVQHILTLEQAQRMADTYRQEVTERRMSAFRLGARA